MGYKETADKILTFAIEHFINMTKDIIPNLSQYPEIYNEIPPIARGFITVKWFDRIAGRLYKIIPKVPEMEKYQIVHGMKQIISGIEDEYMTGVMHKDVNPELGLILEGIGDLKFNDV